MTAVQQLANRWLREAEAMELEAISVEDEILSLKMQEKAMGYRVRSCELEVAICEDRLTEHHSSPVFD